MGDKWMTSGARRLQEKQTHTFAGRRQTKSRSAAPSSRQPRIAAVNNNAAASNNAIHPRLWQRSGGSGTGGYSAYADPVTQRGIVVSLKDRNNVAAHPEHPSRMARRIRDPKRHHSIISHYNPNYQRHEQFRGPQQQQQQQYQQLQYQTPRRPAQYGGAPAYASRYDQQMPPPPPFAGRSSQSDYRNNSFAYPSHQQQQQQQQQQQLPIDEQHYPPDGAFYQQQQGMPQQSSQQQFPPEDAAYYESPYYETVMPPPPRPPQGPFGVGGGGIAQFQQQSDRCGRQQQESSGMSAEDMFRPPTIIEEQEAAPCPQPPPPAPIAHSQQHRYPHQHQQPQQQQQQQPSPFFAQNVEPSDPPEYSFDPAWQPEASDSIPLGPRGSLIQQSSSSSRSQASDLQFRQPDRGIDRLQQRGAQGHDPSGRLGGRFMRPPSSLDDDSGDFFTENQQQRQQQQLYNADASAPPMMEQHGGGTRQQPSSASGLPTEHRGSAALRQSPFVEEAMRQRALSHGPPVGSHDVVARQQQQQEPPPAFDSENEHRNDIGTDTDHSPRQSNQSPTACSTGRELPSRHPDDAVGGLLSNDGATSEQQRGDAPTHAQPFASSATTEEVSSTAPGFSGEQQAQQREPADENPGRGGIGASLHSSSAPKPLGNTTNAAAPKRENPYRRKRKPGDAGDAGNPAAKANKQAKSFHIEFSRKSTEDVFHTTCHNPCFSPLTDTRFFNEESEVSIKNRPLSLPAAASASRPSNGDARESVARRTVPEQHHGGDSGPDVDDDSDDDLDLSGETSLWAKKND